MAYARMLDAFVRELLHDYFGDDIRVDGNDYVIPFDAEPRIRVVEGSGPTLRIAVVALVAEQVTVTPDLLADLNDLNLSLPYGRLVLVEDRVLVQMMVLGESLDWPQLENALRFTDWVARHHGPDLAHQHGGFAPTEPQPPLPLGDGEVVLDDRTAGLLDRDDAPTTGDLVGVNAAGYL
jgi:hypothetical protein